MYDIYINKFCTKCLKLQHKSDKLIFCGYKSDDLLSGVGPLIMLIDTQGGSSYTSHFNILRLLNIKKNLASEDTTLPILC